MAAEAGRLSLRAATADDSAAIAALYAPYVESSIISFETEVPDGAAMRGRIEAGGSLYPWLAAVDESGELAGYAYASAFRPRPAYRYTVETTVYVRGGLHGRGIGGLLYRPLLAILEAQGFTQAFGAIALPNPASVALHEKLGFVRAGTYEQVGWKHGGWWDVGLWQRPLAPPTTPPTEPRPWREVCKLFDPLILSRD
ncbi:MAG TPA: GNAT family N-acetyltransferase [Allosphingosinicella sp.]|nr:GNAT family N-acetyltransferase [Allosphingosinicella sp.]